MDMYKPSITCRVSMWIFKYIHMGVYIYIYPMVPTLRSEMFMHTRFSSLDSGRVAKHTTTCSKKVCKTELQALRTP